MPSLDENYQMWTEIYKWEDQGEEWSARWGGSDGLWFGTLLPRLHNNFPANVILEIAPGYGRMTHYLQKNCKKLIVVDMCQQCIDYCKERFSEQKHIEYHVNDGKSLGCIDDGSVDFVFSWDSLVHAELDVIQGYLEQLAAKLKPGGFGFFHHSNLGYYRDEERNVLTVPNPGFRGRNVSAQKFEKAAVDAGLVCVSQEVLCWSGMHYNDCLSLFMLPHEETKQAKNIRFINRQFCDEWLRMGHITKRNNPDRENRGIPREYSLYERMLNLREIALKRPVYIGTSGIEGQELAKLVQEKMGIPVGGYVDFPDVRESRATEIFLLPKYQSDLLSKETTEGKRPFVIIGSSTYREQIKRLLQGMGYRENEDFLSDIYA